ncbi:MAG: helix-turn-helix domain-containing protein [Propionicimonas sp.]
MFATSDANLQAVLDLRAEVDEALDAFEAASGRQVCFRLLSNRWDGPDGTPIGSERYEIHRSEFCSAWKERDLPACTRCDNNDLVPACSPPAGRRFDPFFRTCHAGADEVIVPLWSQNVLVAVVFVGLLIARDDADPAIDLPRLDALERRRLLGLSRPLRHYLLDVLDRLERIKAQPGIGKRGVIESYLREHLAHGPTLAGLGARLNLSVSRTSHVVREVTGQSFHALLEDYRIAIAKDLLSRTDTAIAAVGRQAGFLDAGYFSRYFKQKTGLSPQEFRRSAARRVTV